MAEGPAPKRRKEAQELDEEVCRSPSTTSPCVELANKFVVPPRMYVAADHVSSMPRPLHGAEDPSLPPLLLQAVCGSAGRSLPARPALPLSRVPRGHAPP